MKVLVPYDGSELSEQAAVMAMELLAQYRLELLLLHVAPGRAQESEDRARLEAAAGRLVDSPTLITPIMAFGNPAQEIVRCADQHGADLIAMSTHGRSMLARMLLGSVTDRVIRTSPVPVAVLHPPTMQISRLSPTVSRKLRILAPFDGSTFAADAIGMSVSLLRPELVDMTLLTILTPIPPSESLQADFDALAERLRDRGISVTKQATRGDAAYQIARTAIDGGYDLVVMSTHGHGMLARALIGSTTDRLVRTSEVPVLVIQPRLMETPFDPVSGEEIDPDNAAYTSEYHGRTFAFASFENKQRFDGAPEAFIGQRLARPGHYPSPYEGFATGPISAVPVPPDA